jgi:hypothetical protein
MFIRYDIMYDNMFMWSDYIMYDLICISGYVFIVIKYEIELQSSKIFIRAGEPAIG